MRLTPDGKMLYDKAARIEEAASDIESSLLALASPECRNRLPETCDDLISWGQVWWGRLPRGRPAPHPASLRGPE